MDSSSRSRTRAGGRRHRPNLATTGAVLLAMRTYGGYHYNLGRETFLVPVTWEDGWPVLAPGDGRVPAHVQTPAARTWRPGAAQGRTSGVVRPQDLRWTSLRRPASEFSQTILRLLSRCS